MSPQEPSSSSVSYSVTAVPKMELTVPRLALLTRWVCDGRVSLVGGAEECVRTHAPKGLTGDSRARSSGTQEDRPSVPIPIGQEDTD